MSRHLRSVMQHGTLTKWSNLIRVEMERKLRRVELKGHPYIVFIDPCNFCNLRCPLCPTGFGGLGRVQHMMSLECFKRYLDPHLPYLFEVIMHNWGEPLINKDIYKMVDYAQSNNVGTNLSSNFVIPRTDDLENILDSGLEYLTISLDGADQESYEQYRVRGDFERVIENLREFLRLRNARKSKTPFVEWQYIVMRHNEHKVEDAERMARKIGVDLLRFIPVGLPFETRNRKELSEKWFPTGVHGKEESDGTEHTFGQRHKPSPCYYLYRSMVVNADGGISPCCIVYQEKRDFDDLRTVEGPIDIMKVWNNDHYRSARSLFSAVDIDKRKQTVCDVCDLFEQHPSKVSLRSKPYPSGKY